MAKGRIRRRRFNGGLNMKTFVGIQKALNKLIILLDKLENIAKNMEKTIMGMEKR